MTTNKAVAVHDWLSASRAEQARQRSMYVGQKVKFTEDAKGQFGMDDGLEREMQILSIDVRFNIAVLSTGESYSLAWLEAA